ncbi:hypothetical protein M153_5870001573 [Pseudoloma neurophilia]|uniref:Uncharacterized protein n=1 Tax=Pseudoloma neurophilia TaxID=146866 RepID=A0A0R0M3Y1_9MICR|nr:hypothetical protein M153_5870001573 [Pseudoloma neurophilia]
MPLFLQIFSNFLKVNCLPLSQMIDFYGPCLSIHVIWNALTTPFDLIFFIIELSVYLVHKSVKLMMQKVLYSLFCL